MNEAANVQRKPLKDHFKEAWKAVSPDHFKNERKFDSMESNCKEFRVCSVLLYCTIYVKLWFPILLTILLPCFHFSLIVWCFLVCNPLKLFVSHFFKTNIRNSISSHVFWNLRHATGMLNIPVSQEQQAWRFSKSTVSSNQGLNLIVD